VSGINDRAVLLKHKRMLMKLFQRMTLLFLLTISGIVHAQVQETLPARERSISSSKPANQPLQRISAVPYEQFKRMSNKERMEAFVYDDTTRLILSHHYKYIETRNTMAASVLLAWTVGAATSSYLLFLSHSEGAVLLVPVVLFSNISGVGLIYPTLHFAHVSSRKYLYRDLLLYAEQHKVNKHTAAYIRKQAEWEKRRLNVRKKN
jgi:hypothetical protein